MEQYFIQYHNADNLGWLPYTDINQIEKIIFSPTKTERLGFFTRKQLVEKAVGDHCFIIVGTGKKSKLYYLWSLIGIDKVERDTALFNAYGTGFNFERPILLNDLPGFSEFKSICGNFGFGFQNITKYEFCKTLVDFADDINPLADTSQRSETQKNLLSALKELNEQMRQVEPEKRLTEIQLILRNDRKIVTLLKKAASYKCQFPDCKAEIKTKSGLNYVEVAHVTPVNKGGQSVLGNLLVLCPNHHKEFDYGDLKIVEQRIDRLSGLLNGKYFRIELIKTNS